MNTHIRLPLALIACWPLCLAGCGKPNPADRYQRPDKVADFGRLFATNCQGCHGKDGTLGAAPPLNDPIFLSIVESEDIAMVVAAGRKGTLMPAFGKKQGGTLTEKQVEILAEGIMHWRKEPRMAVKDIPHYEAKKSEGDASKGKQVFATACASCHAQGLGKPLQAGPLDNPYFLELISNQALRRLMITGRPDLGMPDFASDKGRPAQFKPLTSEDIADLVALLASWRPAPVKTEP